MNYKCALRITARRYLLAIPCCLEIIAEMWRGACLFLEALIIIMVRVIIILTFPLSIPLMALLIQRAETQKEINVQGEYETLIQTLKKEHDAKR